MVADNLTFEGWIEMITKYIFYGFIFQIIFSLIFTILLIKISLLFTKVSPKISENYF